MPIQRLRPPTLKEVSATIGELEAEFQLSSSDFVKTGSSAVPEEVAAEWSYALSQQRELLKVQFEAPSPTFGYLKVASGPRTRASSRTNEIDQDTLRSLAA